MRSGNPTELTPSSATLHYTGRSELFTPAGDLVELSNMNKAMVDCEAWGAVTCRSQRPVSISTQPVGITAQVRAGDLIVNWGAPISRGGTAITGYTATAFDAPNGGNPVGTCTAGGEARSCTIGGLTLGGTFYAEVVARNAVGASAASAARNDWTWISNDVNSSSTWESCPTGPTRVARSTRRWNTQRTPFAWATTFRSICFDAM